MPGRWQQLLAVEDKSTFKFENKNGKYYKLTKIVIALSFAKIPQEANAMTDINVMNRTKIDFSLTLWKMLKYRIPQTRKMRHAIRSHRLTIPLTASTCNGWVEKSKAAKVTVFESNSRALRNSTRRQQQMIWMTRFTVFMELLLNIPSISCCRANERTVNGR